MCIKHYALFCNLVFYSIYLRIFFPVFFFLNDPAPTEISPLPLPAPLPICFSLHCVHWVSKTAVRSRPRSIVCHCSLLATVQLSWPSVVPLLRGQHFGVARLCMSFRSEEHTSELQSQSNLVCRLLLEKKKY